MSRVYNFAPGPAMLPEEVLTQAGFHMIADADVAKL